MKKLQNLLEKQKNAIKKFTGLYFFIFVFAFPSNAQMQLTLTPSNYNGYNIDCSGNNSGSIIVTVSGGTAPYQYDWTNGRTTQSISSLQAGYYKVKVTDANNNSVDAEITLTQPEPFRAGELIPYVYPNGYNVSQYGSCNGSVSLVNTDGGVTPYTYQWDPGQQTTATPTNLCANENRLTVTDANGCNDNANISLQEPERSDWQMTGNTGSNPTTHFLGTLDNQDLSFKTYNQERLRILANGDFKINSLAGTGYQIMMTDANGNVLRLNKQNAPNLIPWNTRGNDNIDDTQDFIGPKNNMDFIIKTGTSGTSNFTEKIRVGKSGEVYFGGINYLGSKSARYEFAHADLNGGISINRTAGDATYPNSVKSELRFNYQGNEKWAIGNDLNNSGAQSFYIWDHAANSGAGATRLFIDPNGKTGIGTEQPTQKLEIKHDDVNGGLVINRNNSIVSKSQISFQQQGAEKWAIGINSEGWNNDPTDNFFIYQRGTAQAMRFLIDADGKVGIGVTPPAWASGTGVIHYMLYVENGIMTRDVKVTAQTPFPDYVFAKGYKPMSIYELEQFITINHQLPEMPSAKEIETANGYEVGDMITKLVKKVEEQTLYIIEQQKQIDVLKVQVKKLERR